MRDEGGAYGAAGEIADTDREQILRTQGSVCAQQHGFVVGWELRDWLAAEQDWFPKANRT